MEKVKLSGDVSIRYWATDDVLHDICAFPDTSRDYLVSACDFKKGIDIFNIRGCYMALFTNPHFQKFPHNHALPQRVLHYVNWTEVLNKALDFLEIDYAIV